MLHGPDSASSLVDSGQDLRDGELDGQASMAEPHVISFPFPGLPAQLRERSRSARVRQAIRFDEVQGIPQPVGEMSQRLRHYIVLALEERDTESLLGILLLCSVWLPASDRCLAAWLPALIGMEELRRQGRPMICEGKVHDHIDREVRNIFGTLPHADDPLWIIPTQAEHHCAAHLAALLCTAAGEPARPWLWRMAPPSQRFLSIGERLPNAQESPWLVGGRHLRILGPQGLLSLLAACNRNDLISAAPSDGYPSP